MALLYDNIRILITLPSDITEFGHQINVIYVFLWLVQGTHTVHLKCVFVANLCTRCFELQLRLSEKFHLPLFLHCRNAADDLYNILLKFPKVKGVVHSFDGTKEEAKRFIDLGFYIGLNGCSLKTQENMNSVASLPSNRILLETDCPWCEIRPSHAGHNLISKQNQTISSVKKEKWTPNHMVKSRNEPNNIRQVFDIVSGVRNEDPDDLCEKIHQNTLDLFSFNKEK